MTKTWKIMALKQGEMEVRKAQMIQGYGYDVIEWQPVFAFAVWNDEHRVLIDTGIKDRAYYDDIKQPFHQLDDETILGSIKKGLGWEADDVDYIIQTHLHVDHAGGLCYFRNAPIFVQKLEWDAALNPVSSQKLIYVDEHYAPEYVNTFRWRYVEGMAEILPGIKVLLTKGHSAGHQVVLVNTEEGVCCITGDVIGRLENISLNIAPALHMNIDDCYDCIKMVRRYAEFVLPCHDAVIEKYQTSCWPKAVDIYGK